MRLISVEELGTILAALRYYQEQGLAADAGKRPEGINDIATDGGTLEALDDEGIDDLAGWINGCHLIETALPAHADFRRQPLEIHQGIDYTVAMLPDENTEEPSFSIYGHDQQECAQKATHLALLWNDNALQDAPVRLSREHASLLLDVVLEGTYREDTGEAVNQLKEQLAIEPDEHDTPATS